jgi:hypothetical protein
MPAIVSPQPGQRLEPENFKNPCPRFNILVPTEIYFAKTVFLFAQNLSLPETESRAFVIPAVPPVRWIIQNPFPAIKNGITM